MPRGGLAGSLNKGKGQGSVETCAEGIPRGPSQFQGHNFRGESLLASTPVVVLSSILGRTPSIEEYKTAVKGIDLTKFAPPAESLRAAQQ